MDDDSNDLFAIAISSEDDDDAPAKVPRDFQSEADFQQQRAEWTAPIETGQIWKSLVLPVDAPSKQEMQKLLHAIEELYFLRDFEQAVGIADGILKGKDLTEEFRGVVEKYRERCVGRLEKAKAG